MTIGIACALWESVILLADGRTRHYGLPGYPIADDDSNKISIVGNSLAIVCAGLTDLTQRAVSCFEFNYEPNLTCEGIYDLMQFSLATTWSRAVVKPEVDTTDPKFAGTFLVGGFGVDSQFVASVAHHLDGHIFKTLSTTVGDSIIIHPLEETAHNYLNMKLEEGAVGKAPKGLDSDWIEPVIRCGTQTIRWVERQDIFVGGTIRYAIIKRGIPAQTGIAQG